MVWLENPNGLVECPLPLFVLFSCLIEAENAITVPTLYAK